MSYPASVFSVPANSGRRRRERLLLDFDSEPPADLLDRIRFAAYWLSLGRPGPVAMTKTRRGYHVTVSFAKARPLSPEALVAVQAICGSDYRREVYNLARARNLASAPAFWRKRSNVLYARKL